MNRPYSTRSRARSIHYRYEHKPTTSVLEILRNYEGVMRAKGFEPIVACRGNKYPGLGFGEDETVGTWRWEEPGKGMVWVALHAWYNGGPDAPWSDLTIVETKAMQQTLEANAATEARAATLADALQQSGHVAIYGITFDFNKATLRPEAAPVLGQVQVLLQSDAKLSIEIEGHTDSIGLPTLQSEAFGRSRGRGEGVAGGARHRRRATRHRGLRRYQTGRGQRDRGGQGEEPPRRTGAAIVSALS